MIAVMAAATFLLWRRMLYGTRWMLWIILLCFPLPYIANTAGWMTAEVGRQPWLVYGLLRTTQGYSNNVNVANSLFTLLGYMGLYLMLGILFIFIMQREVFRGPEQTSRHSTEAEMQITTA
jgi:cytochrome d ubiquinol oxidase subunit I